MEFPRSARRSRPESIVPMINVVFLLLIFFLMTARIAPPAPFDVAPPASTREGALEGARALHVAADGSLAFGSARGEAVFDALSEHDGPLLVRADAALPIDDFARLLADLAARGLRDTRVVTVPR